MTSPIFDELAAESLSNLGLPHAPDPSVTGELPVSDVHTVPPPRLRLGLQPPHSDERAHPRLRLGHFLRAEYTLAVPQVVDYSTAVTGWGMMLNDRLGSCTAAAAGHACQLWTAYGQGQTWTPTDDEVQAFYSASTGYDPADPATDRGGVMQDVLAHWRRDGLAGHKLEAFFQVDPGNEAEVRTALYLFGSVNVGMAFPRFAMDQFDAGQPWHVSTIAPRNGQIDGGHCVLLVKMTQGGNLVVVTWGRLQEITPAFWRRYVVGMRGETWAMAEQDWVRNDAAPANALHIGALNAEFVRLTGEPGPFVGLPPKPAPPSVIPESRADVLRDLAGDLDNAAARLRRLADWA